MADLYHLFDEVARAKSGADELTDATDDNDNDGKNASLVEHVTTATNMPSTTTATTTMSTTEEDGNDEDNAAAAAAPIEISLPVALREAAQYRKRQQHYQRQRDGQGDDNDDDDDDDPDMDDYDKNKLEDHIDMQLSRAEKEEHNQALAVLPYTQLRRLWQQECHSPELMPYNEDVMNTVADQLEAQESYLDELASGESSLDGNAHINALLQSALRVDMERIKFGYADLCRQRLRKIETYPVYMARNNLDYLSDVEVQYLQRYGMLMEAHMRHTVLDHISVAVRQALDDAEMIDTPDTNAHVFCRAKQDIRLPHVVMPPPFNNHNDDNNIHDHDDWNMHNSPVQEHAAGSCLIVRYERIRELLQQGQIELL